MYTSTDDIKADYQNLLEGFVAALWSYNSAIVGLKEKLEFESFVASDEDCNVLKRLRDNVNSFIPKANALKTKINVSVNSLDNPLLAGYFAGLLLKWNDVCSCVNYSFDFLVRNRNNAIKGWIRNNMVESHLALCFRNLQFCIMGISIIHHLDELDVVKGGTP